MPATCTVATPIESEMMPSHLFGPSVRLSSTIERMPDQIVLVWYETVYDGRRGTTATYCRLFCSR